MFLFSLDERRAIGLASDAEGDLWGIDVVDGGVEQRTKRPATDRPGLEASHNIRDESDWGRLRYLLLSAIIYLEGQSLPTHRLTYVTHPL